VSNGFKLSCETNLRSSMFPLQAGDLLVVLGVSSLGGVSGFSSS
jgi:hypothetical protein